MTRDELHEALTADGWHECVPRGSGVWKTMATGSPVLGTVRAMHGNVYTVTASTMQGAVQLEQVPARNVATAYAAVRSALLLLPELR